MDLLSDNREVIRNDALLLLIKLTKGHTNIQKIVAFENAYERYHAFRYTARTAHCGTCFTLV